MLQCIFGVLSAHTRRRVAHVHGVSDSRSSEIQPDEHVCPRGSHALTPDPQSALPQVCTVESARTHVPPAAAAQNSSTAAAAWQEHILPTETRGTPAVAPAAHARIPPQAPPYNPLSSPAGMRRCPVLRMSKRNFWPTNAGPSVRAARHTPSPPSFSASRCRAASRKAPPAAGTSIRTPAPLMLKCLLRGIIQRRKYR